MNQIMNPVKTIDNLLNKLTMYRLVVYVLSFLLLVSVIFAATGILSMDWVAIIVSSIVIIASCMIVDMALPILFNTASNKNSSLITALILCCILQPSVHAHNLAFLALGGLIAVASKYILAVRHKHLFNPAATAAVVLGLTNWSPAIWWIGTPTLLPFTVFIGLLVLRKIRRFQMFGSFLVVALVVAVIVGFHYHESFGYIMSATFRSSPLIFLGSIMLTEPSTTPPRLKWQYLYGAIVGGLFSSGFSVGSVAATPEISLIIGNAFSYIVSPKYKMSLYFKSKKKINSDIYDFTFSGARGLNFNPGQYLEWTLPMDTADSRGNRRTFSIASAPGEDDIDVVVRLFEPGSKFKQRLMSLEAGDKLIAGQLAGDFTLPKTADQKIVLIAGGVGITPFLSMAKDMVKKKQKRDVILFYMFRTENDYCFSDVWDEASQYGFKVLPVITTEDKVPSSWNGLSGRLNEDVIKKHVPDYTERRFYISGPPNFVTSYKQLLNKINVKKRNIVTDYFAGY